MPNCRRWRIPGGTYFFTVNLLERRSDLLVRHVDALRDAVRRTRRERPFHIDAWVVLPERRSGTRIACGERGIWQLVRRNSGGGSAILVDRPMADRPAGIRPTGIPNGRGRRTVVAASSGCTARRIA